jgi:hypothetical protein
MLYKVVFNGYLFTPYFIVNTTRCIILKEFFFIWRRYILLHVLSLCIQQVKDDLDAHSRPVASCLDQVRQVVASGGDVLSSDEVSTLEKNGRSLKTRYERAVDRTDKLLRRLTAACDELSKFRYF